MDLRKVLALRGPNIWANFPVLEAWLDLGPLNDASSEEMPGFNERLKSWLPSLIEHRCSEGVRGGFFERLRRGTYLAHILEHVTIELQCLAGHEVGFGKARDTGETGVYRVIIEYQDEEVARAALKEGRELCLAAVGGSEFDVAACVQRLRELAAKRALDPATAALVRAARRRKIPVLDVDRNERSLQLGQGHRQRRLKGAISDRTRALGVRGCIERVGLMRALQAWGLPAAECRRVESDGEAWETAQEIGLPVIVQPLPGSASPGQPLLCEEDVRSAYQTASARGTGVLVQRCVAGNRWRLLVMNERLVAAAQILPEGNRDVTETIHADVAARAVEAAQAAALDIAGVDVIADDLRRPLEVQRGLIVDVCADPDLTLHAHAGSERLERVAETIVDELFPASETGRIPVVGVTGVNGKTTTVRLIAHLLGRVHRCVGMTCTEGIYINGRRIETGDCSGPLSARTILQHPRVEAAVLETARGGILRAGLGFDRCSVAVVTNVADGDHLGISDIDTPEKLAKVKRTVVDVVAPEGAAVLKADDPLVAAMAEYCPGKTIFFACSEQHPVIVQHRAAGGRAAFVRDGRILLADGDQEIPLVPLELIPLTHGGQVKFQVENALAAAAAAWALGIPCEWIRAGLESFQTSLQHTPGRFNLLEIGGTTVVLDYGHNVASLSELIDTLAGLPHARRTAVYSAAGDRREADILRQAQLLGNAFERVVLYEEDACMRGRKPGEIFGLFQQGMAGCPRTTEVDKIVGAVKAAEHAIATAQTGELVVIQVDRVDETIALAQAYLARGAREIQFSQARELGAPASAQHTRKQTVSV
ncbi:MAG: Mur ligase family protein [Gemmataceae bacterium]